MDQELIDLQFDRAVEIVQGLPKNGPIQTGYEEKLQMYSLYKQATAGNVQMQRPGMFDMLGRAKYDAWAKQKDLGAREAKWQYVETLMRVLRKYSDRTVARDLVQELESYGDPSNVVMSGSLSRTSGSDSEESQEHEADEHLNGNGVYVSHEQPITDSETDEDNEPEPEESPTNIRRPGSAISSQQRYRTPLAGSTMAMNNPPLPAHVFSPPIGSPGMQPLPEHPTPSVFGSTQSPKPPFNSYPRGPGSQRSTSPRNYPPNQPYRGTPSFQRGSLSGGQSQVVSAGNRAALERALENMQTSLSALHERLERLEGVVVGTNVGGGGNEGFASRPSLVSQHRSRISSPNARNRPNSPYGLWPTWDVSNMGAWSLVLQPLSRLETHLRAFAWFIATSDEDDEGHHRSRSPILVMVRRLFLDLSFLLVVLVVLKRVWRSTGMRRREVLAALGEVWRALAGKKGPPRLMVDKAV